MRLVRLCAVLGVLVCGWAWAQEVAGPYADFLRLSREGKAHEFARRLEPLAGSQDPALIGTLAQCHEWVFTCDGPVRVDDILAGVRNPAAVEPLLDLYRTHPRDAAAFSLAYMGDTRVAPLAAAELIRRARKDPDAPIPPGMADPSRDPALEEKDGFLPLRDLLTLIGPDAVEPLLPALESRDMRIRAIAAQALGRIADPRAVEALGKSLATCKEPEKKKDDDSPLSFSFMGTKRPPEPNARAEVSLALMRIGDPKAVPALLDAITEADAAGFMPGATAHWSLDESASPCGALIVLGWQDMPALLAGLKSDKWYVRCCTLRVLGYLGLAEGREAAAGLVRDTDARVRRAALAAVARLRHPDAYRWVGEALHDRDRDTQLWAVDCLGYLPGDAPAARLRGILGSTDAAMRTHALTAYAAKKDPAAVPALLARLDAEPKLALAALAMNPPGPSAIERLMKYAKRDDTASWAASALLKMNHPQATNRLLDILNHQLGHGAAWRIATELISERKDLRAVPGAIKQAEHEGWRGTLVSALGNSGDPRAVEALIRALGQCRPENAEEPVFYGSYRSRIDGPDARVIIRALGELSDARAVAPIVAYAKRVGIAKAFPEAPASQSRHLWPDRAVGVYPVWENRIGATIVRALSACSRANPAVLLPFAAHEDLTVRLAAVEALADIEDVRTARTLVRALDDESPRVFKLAIGGLGNLDDPLARDAVVARTADDRPAEQRELAFRALGLRETDLSHDLAGRVLAALRDPSPDVRAGAAWALGRVPSQPGVDAAIELLADPASKAWLGAATAAKKHADARAMPSFRDALRNPEDAKRRTAAWAQQTFKDPEAVPALVMGARGPGRFERWVFMEALGEMRARAAVPLLCSALYDGARGSGREVAASDTGIARNAAKALGKIADLRAVPALIAMLDGSRASFAPDIAATLKTITGKDFGKDAAAWRRWWLDEGRKAAG